MYSTIDFERSINSLKVKWDDNVFLSRYILLLFPLIWLIIPIIDTTSTGSLQYILSCSLMLSISYLIAFLLFAFLLYLIYKNDKLIKISFNGSTSELRKLVVKELKQSGWEVYRSNPKFLTAQKRSVWLFGSKMVILFHNESVFINVQNIDGARAYLPFSFGRNKRLTKQLILILEKIQLDQTNLT